MNAIKDMCRDVLQEIMVAELEAELGYEKQERRSEDVKSPMSKNYRNGYSKKTVNKVSEKIMPQLNEWQNRPLEAVYPFIFLDAIHYKIRKNHQIITKAAYVVLGEI